MTATEAVAVPTIEELHRKLKLRFQSWVGNLEAGVVPVPDAIDWPTLIRKSIWRKPPFSPRTEEKDTAEKGFKDALILETLLDFHRHAGKREVVFICSDKLLSSTACDHFKDQSGFLAFNSLDEFRSHADLLRNKQSEEFSRAVLSKVNEVFYTDGDPNCIWFKFGVLQQIHDALGIRLTGIFSEIYDPTPTSILDRLGIANPPLRPITEEAAFIKETLFIRQDAEYFYWRTTVELHQIFAPKQSPHSLSTTGKQTPPS